MSTVGNIVGIQAQEIAKVAEKYATMSTSEVEVGFHTMYICVLYNLQYFISIHFYMNTG